MLKSLVVADPVGDVAEMVTNQCRRLALTRVIATTGEDTSTLVQRLKPEVLVVSQEISRPTLEELVPRFIKMLPDLLIVATFREMTIPKMEQLNRLGVDDFIAQPVNATEIFRAVSRRFNTPFRQFHRFDVVMNVIRADGVHIGNTLNISEGGVRLQLTHAFQADESLLVDIILPNDVKPLRARCRLLSIEPAGSDQLIARSQFENLRGEEHRRLVHFLDGLDIETESDVHE